ncbi:hypothetical protein Ccrd_005140 [Cynara cardunculus var. scolymus]|uniref:Uncharacterized protein n=1 Tax=Cynara cardunculus var. scolymus TaxID=59895 RepID=A0A118JVN5_CYNCS|nr:hypothetical protein Ccrd_005140 [Cynara cardunculus var. scolymus]
MAAAPENGTADIPTEDLVVDDNVKYGYVTPNDIPELLDQHINKGEIIERIWRGQMGAEKAEKAVEPEPALALALPNGNGLKVNEKDETVKEEKENSGGCCQGATGFSCCRDETSEVKKKSTSKLDLFSKKWEQHDIFTAAAVIGAVATVAVAYSLYKRSR